MDWDDDEDGVWEAPLVANPACESAAGCGEWKRPMKANPDYKGVWEPAKIDNPNYFSSAVVIAMFTSVLLPITISTIHLMVNNRHMLMRFVNLGTSRLRRILIAALLVLLTPFHPVLLDYLHLVTSEEARTLIQNYDPAALQLMQECRKIQVHNANLLKIELGKPLIMVV